MAEYPDPRISATRRDRAPVELSDHFSSGRLDVTDYEERTAATVAATTSVEVAALFADLPGAAQPPGKDRIAVPWPACLVAGALVVTPALAHVYNAATRRRAMPTACTPRLLRILGTPARRIHAVNR